MSQSQDKTFLGTEPIGKLLVKLAVPTVVAQLVNMLYNIVDRIYIGHMPGDGSLALTGVGVCLPLIMIISAFAALVASGGAPRASIAMGKGDHGLAEKLLGGCFTLQVVISAILTTVMLIFSRDLLLMFGASENTIGYAADYMRIYAIGTLFVQLTLGMNAFITAQGFATTGMLTVLIGAVANIALDPLFIYGLGMGVVYTAMKQGKPVHVYTDETRPRMQGTKINTFDLKRMGVPYTLICDDTSALLMKLGKIDMVFISADRVVGNGDVAAKIGVYGIAICAKEHGIPVYCFAPTSTIDYNLKSGDDIKLEQRPADEVLNICGTYVAPPDTPVLNYAFDVTPAKYWTAIITEKGIAYPPFSESLLKFKD